MDGDGGENEAQIHMENVNYLEYQEDREEFHPNKEYQNIQQPVKVELGTLEEGPTSI